MAYIDGFVAAVATADRETYRAHAERMAGFMRRFGATEVVETWGDDVPEGKLTSFPMAVQRKEGETVVFSWVKWPDKATRDAAWTAMEGDSAMFAEPMPFDGKRMIFGGFEVILEA